MWTVPSGTDKEILWPNAFVVHAQGFLARGGYDERLSGTYGLEDVMIRKRAHHGHFVLEVHPTFVYKSEGSQRARADDHCPTCRWPAGTKESHIETQRRRVQQLDSAGVLTGSPPVNVEWDVEWMVTQWRSS